MTAPKMSEVFELPLSARSPIWAKDGAPITSMEAAVRAINAHDALVEALRHARDQIQHPDQMIDEAIALAEGRS